MANYQNEVAEKNSAHYRLTSAPSSALAGAGMRDREEVSDSSLAYHSQVLLELVKRADERLEGLRSLADFLAGAEPSDKEASGPKPVPSGLSAEIRERVTMLESRLNGMAHEFGRLDRAIRG